MRLRRDLEDPVHQGRAPPGICSQCHPFFTGRQKLIDTEGRVERFAKKFGVQTSESRKAAAKAKKAGPKTPETPAPTA